MFRTYQKQDAEEEMRMWKDSDGRWIDFREFRTRFAKGVEGITPLEQTRTQLIFSWITVVGILCGLGVSIVAWKTLWWLGIILLAGLGNTLVGIIGIYQKYKQLKRIEDALMNQEEYDNMYPVEVKA